MISGAEDEAQTDDQLCYQSEPAEYSALGTSFFIANTTL